MYSQGLCLAYLCLTAAYMDEYEPALEYGRKALETAEAINNRPVLGSAYANLGLAHLFAGNHSTAQTAFNRSIEIRQDIGEQLPIIESAAGLLLSLLASADTKNALPLADKLYNFLLLDHLPAPDNHPLIGADNPAFVYVACYKGLIAVEGENGRATAVLQAAHSLLQHRASRIIDETLKRPFLHKVPFNREITAIYQAADRNKILSLT
jgi:tetratricopeptide (TPR) repeat protein